MTLLTELLFLGLALILLYAGANLARYGQAIAEKTGISSTWVGLFLVAAVTSIPELVTGLSSILVVNAPDLAVGDALGSTLLNLGLAAAVGLATRAAITTPTDRRLYVVARGYLSAMLLLVTMGILLAQLDVATRWLGVITAGLVILYFAATRHLFHLQSDTDASNTHGWSHVSKGHVIARYGFYGFITVAAAVVLPPLADRLAAEHKIGLPIVGTVLLAVSTSLPELVVTVSAIRMHATGLALGGLLGSNLFDLVLLAVDDLFYAQGPLFAAIAVDHLATATASLAITWLLVAAFPGGSRPRTPFLIATLVTYALFIVGLTSGTLVPG